MQIIIPYNTLCSILLSAEHSQKVRSRRRHIQQFLGHSDPKTTLRYIRRAEELAARVYHVRSAGLVASLLGRLVALTGRTGCRICLSGLDSSFDSLSCAVRGLLLKTYNTPVACSAVRLRPLSYNSLGTLREHYKRALLRAKQVSLSPPSQPSGRRPIGASR
jgi:hypothetical protein